jgi:hypothetical protein
MSNLNWIYEEGGKEHFFNALSFTHLTVALFVSALSFFIGIEFVFTFGVRAFMAQKFYVWVAIATALYVLLPYVLWAIGFPYWFYYIDVIQLVVIYTLLCFALGFFGMSMHLYTTKQRVLNGLLFLATETIVSAVALLYGMFLMQVYVSLDDDKKMLWRLTVHPLYFELLMMLPVRYLVKKQLGANGKELSVVQTLAIVHAQVRNFQENWN